MEFREPIEQLIHDPREYTKDVHFPPASELRIYDTSLRDGEQMCGIAYTPETKYEICRRLSDIGVHIMDVGFPAVSEDERRSLQLIMDGKRKGEIREDLDVVVMCRSTSKDIDATLSALAEIDVAPSEVTFFVFTSGSDLHMKYKIGKALLAREGKPESEWLDLPLSFFRQANIRMQCDAIRYARDHGVERVEFGGEDGSRGDVDYFIELFKAGLEAGATRPSWPDTVGCLTPEATRWYSTRIVDAMPAGVTLLNHFHNDYGLGTINCITSLVVRIQGVHRHGERLWRARRQRAAAPSRHGAQACSTASTSRVSSTTNCGSWRASWSPSPGTRYRRTSRSSARTCSRTNRGSTRTRC